MVRYSLAQRGGANVRVAVNRAVVQHSGSVASADAPVTPNFSLFEWAARNTGSFAPFGSWIVWSGAVADAVFLSFRWRSVGVF